MTQFSIGIVGSSKHSSGSESTLKKQAGDIEMGWVILDHFHPMFAVHLLLFLSPAKFVDLS